MAAPPDHDDDELHGYRGLIPVLEAFDKPLLAAVNGLGIGIGATLLPYCDIVWIAEGARLKVPFVTLGVTTEAAGSLLLPQRMGWQDAAHFIFTAEWMSAEEAVACGLAWKVCAPDALLDDVMEVARKIGAMPVDSLQTTKRLMVAGRARRRARRPRARGRRVRPHGRLRSQPAGPRPVLQLTQPASAATCGRLLAVSRHRSDHKLGGRSPSDPRPVPHCVRFRV